MTFAFLSISFQGINIFQFFKKWVKLDDYDERALLTSQDYCLDREYLPDGVRISQSGKTLINFDK